MVDDGSWGDFVILIRFVEGGESVKELSLHFTNNLDKAISKGVSTSVMARRGVVSFCFTGLVHGLSVGEVTKYMGMFKFV